MAITIQGKCDTCISGQSVTDPDSLYNTTKRNRRYLPNPCIGCGQFHDYKNYERKSGKGWAEEILDRRREVREEA